MGGARVYSDPSIYFNVLSILFFFFALISILTYMGITGWAVKKIGVFLALIMGTSAAETLYAAANIFLGFCEAPMLIRDFLADLTESEIHAMLTGGFASIAGTVFGIYISFGAPADALLGASIMSAPAALAISKIIYPETKEAKSAGSFKFEVSKPMEKSLIEAAANGASMAVPVVLEIGAQLIAFIALIAMLDGFLLGIGSLINVELSFALICGYAFYPVAWLMGVPPQDCTAVASLLGSKIFVNEFVAFTQLSTLIENGEITAKSVTIATYALCGFSNFSAIGVAIGVFNNLVPTKKRSVTKLAFSSMVAGNTACFMTAAIAGLFYDPSLDAPMPSAEALAH